MNYSEAIEFLNNTPQYAKLSGVERTRILLEEMKHPEKNLKIIHVAGTNGKGSVCSYLDSILSKAGFYVGLFTSPHLVDIRERVQVGQAIISEALFTEGFNVVYEAQKNILQKHDIELAYFDILLGIALYCFAKENVDYMVMETGLGGKLDSTNAIENQIISIITSISLEHTQILGDTVEKIAGEKAGIIKSNTPVVFTDKVSGVSQVISNVAKEHNSSSFAVNEEQWKILKNNGKVIDFSLDNRYYKSNVFSIASGAMYQVENCCLALTAIAVLLDTGKLKISMDKICAGTKSAFWSGRMEEVFEDVYIDGAHNPDGIKAMIAAAKSIANGRKAILLFSVVKDKKYESMIQSICEDGVFDRYIITGITGTRRLETDTITKTFAKYTDKPVNVFEHVGEAYRFGRSIKQDGMLFCAGSLYLVGEIKGL